MPRDYPRSGRPDQGTAEPPSGGQEAAPIGGRAVPGHLVMAPPRRLGGPTHARALPSLRRRRPRTMSRARTISGDGLLRSYFCGGVRSGHPLLSSSIDRKSLAYAACSDSKLLYRLLRDELSETGAGQDILRELIGRYSVWFPRTTYLELPVLLPHVRRDNGCRKQLCANPSHVKKTKGHLGDRRDLWSTPTHEGFVRDDNSLIKALVRTLPIASPDAGLDGARVGAGFVACHIHPMKDADDPWMNSFIPNLVWLPQPLDKLSDISGSFVQLVLQDAAQEHFGPLPTGGVPTFPKAVVPSRQLDPPQSTWVCSSAFLRRKRRRIEEIGNLLGDVAAGRTPKTKSGHTHYDLHIVDLDRGSVAPLSERISWYLSNAA